MKNLLIIWVVLIFFSACKKDYTCTCEHSNNVSASLEKTTDKYRVKRKAAKRLKENCTQRNWSETRNGVTFTTICEWEFDSKF